MSDIKEQVLNRFVDFVLRYVPIATAQLGGLGGQGIEAKIWANRGIPHSNGWIVERNQNRGAHLIAGRSYNVQNHLSTLSRVMRATRGSDALLDGFHLDLCGTFSRQVMVDFNPVFGLVLESRGRSLAVTVADARRNVALENWPQSMGRAKRLLGRDAVIIYEALVEQQRRIPVVRHESMPAFIKSFDPEKAAKREFALFVELVKLFRRYAFDCVTVERFVYVSRYSGRPFRMRTYFFHFEPTHSNQRAALLSKSWLGSPFTILKADGTAEVVPLVRTIVSQPISKPTTMKGTTVIKTKLQELVAVLGGEFASEYEALLADRTKLETFTRAVQGLGMTPDLTATLPVGRKPLVPGEFRKTKTTRTWDDFNDQEQIEWLLKALELKAHEGDDWRHGQWKELIQRDFGRYSVKVGRRMRSALAHTGGKFRKQFVDRIHRIFPGAAAAPYLDRLTKIAAK